MRALLCYHTSRFVHFSTTLLLRVVVVIGVRFFLLSCACVSTCAGACCQIGGSKTGTRLICLTNEEFFFRANTKNTGTFFFFSKHKLPFFLVDLKKYTQTTDNVLLCSILLLLLLLLRIIILKIQEKQNDETCLNYRRPL